MNNEGRRSSKGHFREDIAPLSALYFREQVKEWQCRCIRALKLFTQV